MGVMGLDFDRISGLRVGISGLRAYRLAFGVEHFSGFRVSCLRFTAYGLGLERLAFSILR